MALPAKSNADSRLKAVAPDRLEDFPTRRRRHTATPDTKDVLLYTLVLLMIAAPLFIYLYQNASMTRKGYELQQLEDRMSEMRLERERLQLELSELSSPERIERIAQARLNMVYPERVEFIEVASAKQPARTASAGVTGAVNGVIRGLSGLGFIPARLSEAEASQP